MNEFPVHSVSKQHKHHSNRVMLVVGLVAIAALALGVLNNFEFGTPSSFQVESALAMNESKPVRIEIPSIGVDAPIAETGLKEDQTAEVPDEANEVGWYKYSQTPGEIGPSVLIGHLDWTDGPAVFFDIKKLKPGSVIKVTREDGSIAVFNVESIEQYRQNEFPTEEVYGKLKKSGLRLVTCSGSFIGEQYSHNLVVYAALVQTIY